MAEKCYFQTVDSIAVAWEIFDQNQSWICASLLSSSTDPIHQNRPGMSKPRWDSNIWGAWGTNEPSYPWSWGVVLKNWWENTKRSCCRKEGMKEQENLKFDFCILPGWTPSSCGQQLGIPQSSTFPWDQRSGKLQHLQCPTHGGCPHKTWVQFLWVSLIKPKTDRKTKFPRSHKSSRKKKKFWFFSLFFFFLQFFLSAFFFFFILFSSLFFSFFFFLLQTLKLATKKSGQPWELSIKCSQFFSTFFSK